MFLAHPDKGNGEEEVPMNSVLCHMFLVTSQLHTGQSDTPQHNQR